MPIAFRYAARSDVGRVRSKNDDSAYAGRHLVVLADGTELPADLVVYATGYGSMNGWAADLMGQETADTLGKCWGLGSATTKDPGPWEGEQRNMWKPTQQENLWFHGGNLHQSRHYSLYLALQTMTALEPAARPTAEQVAAMLVVEPRRGRGRGRAPALPPPAATRRGARPPCRVSPALVRHRTAAAPKCRSAPIPPACGPWDRRSAAGSSGCPPRLAPEPMRDPGGTAPCPDRSARAPDRSANNRARTMWRRHREQAG